MMAGVVDTAVAALTAAGIAAGCAWPKTAVSPGSSFVKVGVARAGASAGGFARYLGVERDPETGEREVYGLRCDLTLRLDVYAPLSAENAATACLDLFDAAADAIASVPGLRLTALRCGAPAPDRETGMFRLEGAAECRALLVASGAADEGTFTDFVLRGELRE